MALTERQLTALDCFRGERGGTISDLAERCGSTRASAHHMVRRLVASGLLANDHGPIGGKFFRSCRYTLTPSGRAAWAESLR